MGVRGSFKTAPIRWLDTVCVVEWFSGVRETWRWRAAAKYTQNQVSKDESQKVGGENGTAKYKDSIFRRGIPED